MNSERNMLIRLVKLFPVRVLKDEFNINGTGEALFHEIVDNFPPQTIRDFAYLNVDLTKQHVYIYNLNTPFIHEAFNPEAFPFQIINQNLIGDDLSLIISPIVEFRVILTNPFNEATMNFHQPIKITLRDRTLIFQATILEKNMTTYFEDGREVINVKKLNDEATIIQLVLDYLSNYHPQLCDLNAGIKEMWAADRIDSRYAKWKKNRSTTTEAMDENYTLKQQYPEVYEGLINSPLNKTIFKTLSDTDDLPDHFTVDPSKGEISVPLYPKNENQILNVVNEIISNN